MTQLTDEQLNTYVLHAQAGSPSAEAAVIDELLPLVRRQAQRYVEKSRTRTEYDDLVAEALYQLLLAVRRWPGVEDDSQFIAYAVSCVQGGFKRANRACAFRAVTPPAKRPFTAMAAQQAIAAWQSTSRPSNVKEDGEMVPFLDRIPARATSHHMEMLEIIDLAMSTLKPSQARLVLAHASGKRTVDMLLVGSTQRGTQARLYTAHATLRRWGEQNSHLR